jgi:hypothetical protein
MRVAVVRMGAANRMATTMRMAVVRMGAANRLGTIMRMAVVRIWHSAGGDCCEMIFVL